MPRVRSATGLEKGYVYQTVLKPAFTWSEIGRIGAVYKSGRGPGRGDARHTPLIPALEKQRQVNLCEL